ncbi:MAG: response regulator [Acidobacteriia bacterium]|nr:response regulator [Terriglobia bacterium]
MSLGNRTLLYLGLAGVLAGFYLFVVLRVIAKDEAALLSGLTQMGFVALAGGAIFAGTRRLRGAARELGNLAVAAFAILAVTQILDIYTYNVSRTELTAPWPSDVLRFIWPAPFLLMLLPQGEPGERRLDWLRVMDYAQAGILAVTFYLYFYYVQSRWAAAGEESLRAMWRLYAVRDGVIAGGLLLWYGMGRRGPARTMRGQMGIFFCAASAVNWCIALNIQKYIGEYSWLDLAWGLQFAVAGWFAVQWAAGEKEEERREATRSAALIASQALPVAIPLVVLLMGREIAREQHAVAWVAVAAAFACSSARLVLTNRKQEETAEELASSHRLLQAVIEGTTDAVYVKDLQGRYLMINSAGARFLGMGAEEIAGKSDLELMTKETGTAVIEADRRIMQSGQEETQEQIVEAGGVARTFFTTKSAFRGADGRIAGVVGISREITERVKLERKVQEARKLEAVGTLAGGVAHDFNNLITVIRGYCEMLFQRVEGDAESLQAVRQIDESASRAAFLTSQLLAFSRRQFIRPRVLNLNRVLQEMQPVLEVLIGDKVRLEMQLHPGTGEVKADVHQIEQVVMNLAVNARDAMEGGGRLRIETATAMKETQAQEGSGGALAEHVMVTVTDTGHGMNEETQARVFEPFFTTKGAGRGTGMGLATVYGIVQQNAGQITVQSEVDRGTTFKVFFPRVKEEPETPAPLGLPARQRGGRETILVVDDDNALRELASSVLAGSGYKILTAENAERALSICGEKSGAIDLVLTDVIMPGMNGKELAEKMHAEFPKLRFLFMSGYTGTAAMQHGPLGNKAGFLAKPFTAETLCGTVRRILDGRSAGKG